jgi:broad specificity phosphatase PhoE
VLILVRHGQTTANASGLLLGRADPPLTDVGRRQAEAAAAWLAGIGIRPARVLSSPLQRATATAAGFGAPVEVDDRWVELDYGEYDGLPLADVPDDIWAKWRADDEFCPPGGESFASVGRRVRAACDDLLADAEAGDVVVVSHVSPIKEAVAWALGVGGQIAWRMRLDVAAVCRVGIRNERPSLVSFNETGHLRPLSVSL